MNKPKPTIAELEELLKEDTKKVSILPNGEVVEEEKEEPRRSRTMKRRKVKVGERVLEIPDVRMTDDRILVLHEKEQQTKSGLWMPDNAQESQKIITGVVVAVGPGRWPVEGELRSRHIRSGGDVEEGKRVPLLTKVGDVIVCGHYAGHRVEIERKDYRIMHDGDVLSYINKEEQSGGAGGASRSSDEDNQLLTEYGGEG